VFPDSPQDVLPPDHLSERAREKWLELAPVLSRNGLLTVCDLDTLDLYCTTWVRWKDAEAALQREGMTTTAQSGYQQVSPYYTIASKSQAELRALADRLGLNPSARSRIEVIPKSTSEHELLS
jgi:P27 family predicted phage terminase small subunit